MNAEHLRMAYPALTFTDEGKVVVPHGGFKTREECDQHLAAVTLGDIPYDDVVTD